MNSCNNADCGMQIPASQPGFFGPGPGNGNMGNSMMGNSMQGPGPVLPNPSMPFYADRFPVGMGYVPMQSWETPYPMERGFMRGTIFPALDYPFMMGRCR